MSTLLGLMSRWWTPAAVGGVQCGQHGQADPGDIPGRQRAVLLDDLQQRTGRNVLHDDPWPFVTGLNVVSPHDVGVTQARRGPGLAQGTRAHLLALLVGEPERAERSL
jgi:hypothetical protein